MPMKQRDTYDLGLYTISLKEISRNPLQPRQIFKEESIKELAESIKYNGLLQPIVVRKVAESRYIIIAGERRYRAHQYLKTKDIKANVIECSDSTAYELSLLENIQREDLTLLEEAQGYNHLKKEYDYSLSDLSKVTSKSKASISNILSILNEVEGIQEYVKDGTLTIAAYVWVKQLPNNREKLLLLDKLKKEEVKRTHIRNYVERVCNAYKLAADLNIDPEKLLEKHERKGVSGRFDVLSEVIPEDFRFHFIVDFNVDSTDLPFLPSRNILLSAYNFMKDKSAAKRLALILLEKSSLDRIICDSGVMPAARKKDWAFFTNPEALFKFYELIEPTACVSLDVPLYPFVIENWKIPIKKMQEMTLENAKKFLEWKPSFETTKIVVLQGNNSQEYAQSLRDYQEINAFEGRNVAFGFGGLATRAFSYQEDVVSTVMSMPEVKEVLPNVPFVHAFGIGDPKRIVGLYKYGVTSFDSLTTIILSVTGHYWLCNNERHTHIVHETSMSRRIRMYFNFHSFWGLLAEQFSIYRGIPLSKEERNVSLPAMITEATI